MTLTDLRNSYQIFWAYWNMLMLSHKMNRLGLWVTGMKTRKRNAIFIILLSWVHLLSVQLVAQSCPILCDPMNCSRPGSPVLHNLRVGSNPCPLSRWCHPAISSSVSPFSSCLQPFPASGSFSNESALHTRWTKFWSFSISPSTEYSGWFPLELTGWISLWSEILCRIFY